MTDIHPLVALTQFPKHCKPSNFKIPPCIITISHFY